MRKLIVLLICIVIAMGAKAEEIVQTQLPGASPVGSGRLTYLFWDVYEATLYAPAGQWDRRRPFALTLHYLRSIKGEDIADRSAEEIRRQGFADEIKLAGWYSQMKAIFPDVKHGSKLTGIYMPGQHTRFFSDNQEIGLIRDREFGEWFFNIWLAENTSEPALRKKLLGLL